MMGKSQLKSVGLAFLRISWYNKNSLDGGESAPLRWLCGIQEIMRTFSRPLTEKRRLPRKPTYQASKQAASQGRCVNGLTPLGDGNHYVLCFKTIDCCVLMALPH